MEREGTSIFQMRLLSHTHAGQGKGRGHARGGGIKGNCMQCKVEYCSSSVVCSLAAVVRANTSICVQETSAGRRAALHGATCTTASTSSPSGRGYAGSAGRRAWRRVCVCVCVCALQSRRDRDFIAHGPQLAHTNTHFAHALSPSITSEYNLVVFQKRTLDSSLYRK